jgi:hypothetical protein
MTGASKMSVPGYAVPLVETNEGALIAVWEKEATRAVAVGFDILESNWPLHASFPLFLMNSIEWLRREGGGEWRTHRMPGDVLRLRLAEGETQVEVTAPGGGVRKLSGEPGKEVAYGETDEAGLYSVKRGSGLSELYAFNLMDPQESSGRVVPELKIGEDSVKGAAAPPAPPREFWTWLAWAAAALLCVEWLLFHRRL